MSDAQFLSVLGAAAVVLMLLTSRYGPGWRARLARAGRWRREWDTAIPVGILVAIPVAVVLAIVLDDRGTGAVLLGIAIGVVAGVCAGRIAVVLSRRPGGPRR